MGQKEHYHTMELALMVRDSRTTKGAQRSLLMALALRANPKKGYSCWPSYRRLADDTQYDEVTLRRAAKTLEDLGLIRRKQRSMRSNLFILNTERMAQHKHEADAARRRELLTLLGEDAEIETQADSIAETETLTDTEDQDRSVLLAVTGGR